MSEGGEAGLAKFFSGINYTNKRILDIGAGLGAAACYLAKHHDCEVIGIEINPGMVEQANDRVPAELKNRVKFVGYEAFNQLPFADQAFDVIYSKGVFAHLENKLPLFKEVNRCLTMQGVFLLNDWLSTSDQVWPTLIQEMAEAEDLTMFPTTVERYKEILTSTGFTIDTCEDTTAEYASYNQHIAERLQEPAIKTQMIAELSAQEHAMYVDSYQKIAQAMRAHELLCIKFLCHTTSTS